MKRRSWDEVVTLIAIAPGEDEAGYPTPPKEFPREVLANKLNVKGIEFYAANQTGMKADCIFEVHAFEYEGEKLLEYEGKRYAVIRTYGTNDETLELTCSDKLVIS
ncbi:phage head closure protein [Paenibacillus azoreducens]|uniref:Phage head-tail adapter protein n=1 Tax=Paenibacillus azoreducens TaxID=116718 RepID=A0A920CPM7_9BACL|nr:phage head closure protein [Paenibacillus azoreducens]GIO48851.1 hypothetical protein J34TS1_36160 [Paenibacillus azoreducens]